jgi:hypothetical protein
LFQLAAGVFEGRVVFRDAEGHVGLMRGDAEFLEKADEVWIIHIVEDDEAGIDRHGLAVEGEHLRVGMAAGA